MSWKAWMVSILIVVMLGLMSCAEFQSQTGTVKGGAAGAGVGGLAGILLDRSNPWRGGIIGGALGAVLGGTLGQISDHAAREAAAARKPVEYRTESGHAVLRSEPLGYDKSTGCRKVRERIYERGKLIRSQIKEICDVEG